MFFLTYVHPRAPARAHAKRRRKREASGVPVGASKKYQSQAVGLVQDMIEWLIDKRMVDYDDESEWRRRSGLEPLPPPKGSAAAAGGSSRGGAPYGGAASRTSHRGIFSAGSGSGGAADVINLLSDSVVEDDDDEDDDSFSDEDEY